MPNSADLALWRNQLAGVVTKVKLVSLGRSGTSYQTTVGYQRFNADGEEPTPVGEKADLTQPELDFEQQSDGSQDDPEKLSILANDDSSSDSKGSDIEAKPGDDSSSNKKIDSITEWQAGWNVTNAIQGMFIVSFPYAVLQGGYWAIISMIVVAQICCYTGKILVDCLYEKDSEGNKTRVRGSYGEISQAVFGKRFGPPLINLAQVIELLMTCILYVLLCGELLHSSFPMIKGMKLSAWIFISSLPLLLCAFLKTMRRVSWLSLWCSIAHMLINMIIIIFCLTKVKQWQPLAVRIDPDIWTFPISLGIVVFSYTSQIFLPTLEGKMIKRDKFSCMMHWTHIAAAVFKSIFSYLGFITWGMDTEELITNNLPRGLREVVNIILVIKALFSYPLPYYAAVDIIEKAFFQEGKDTWFSSCYSDEVQTFKWWATALRIMLVIFTMLMAIFVPHFAILMGLIGSVTGTLLSFVWPCIFHLSLKRHELRWWQKAIDIFIVLLGIFCGLLGMYYSTSALVRAFHGLDPRPWKCEDSDNFNSTLLLSCENGTVSSHFSG